MEEKGVINLPSKAENRRDSAIHTLIRCFRPVVSQTSRGSISETMSPISKFSVHRPTSSNRNDCYQTSEAVLPHRLSRSGRRSCSCTVILCQPPTQGLETASWSSSSHVAANGGTYSDHTTRGCGQRCSEPRTEISGDDSWRQIRPRTDLL